MPSRDIGAVSPGYIPPPSVSPPPGRRYFSSADKRNIVAEIERPGETVSAVAKRYDITKRLLFKWKKAYGPKPEPVIVLVTIIDAEAPATTPSQTADLAPVRPPAAPGIEITLKSGHHMRVPVGTDPKAVSALLSQLEGAPS
ncbi:MAG: transposase [Alphaproteobacteria bacterium]